MEVSQEFGEDGVTRKEARRNRADANAMNMTPPQIGAQT